MPTKEIHVDVSSQLCNSRLLKGQLKLSCRQIPYNINYDCIENQVFYRGQFSPLNCDDFMSDCKIELSTLVNQ